MRTIKSVERIVRLVRAGATLERSAATRRWGVCELGEVVFEVSDDDAAEASRSMWLAPEEGGEAYRARTLIRVPRRFFNDHEERDCEPFCEPVARSGAYVYIDEGDVGLGELFDDAQLYADEFGPDELGGNGSLKRSAAATVRAISEWFWSHRPMNATTGDAVTALASSLRSKNGTAS